MKRPNTPGIVFSTAAAALFVARGILLAVVVLLTVVMPEEVIAALNFCVEGSHHYAIHS